MPVGRGRNDPSEAERIAQVGATKAACVDAAAAYVDEAGLRAKTWPGSPSQKVAGPDEGQVDSMRLGTAQGWCKKPRVEDAVATYVEVARFLFGEGGCTKQLARSKPNDGAGFYVQKV